jgi:hypothetical protein
MTIVDMAKIVFSLRLDQTVVDAYKTEAEKQQKTVSALMSEVLTESAKRNTIVLRNVLHRNTKRITKSETAALASAYKHADKHGNERHQLDDFNNLWLSDFETNGVREFFTKRGLEPDYFEDAFRVLDNWFDKKPDELNKSKCHARYLIGWPLDRALESQTIAQKAKRFTPQHQIEKGSKRLNAFKTNIEGQLYGNERECFEVNVLPNDRVSTLRDTRRETTALVRASRRLLPGTTEEGGRSLPKYEPESPSAIIAAIDCGD